MSNVKIRVKTFPVRCLHCKTEYELKVAMQVAKQKGLRDIICPKCKKPTGSIN